MRPKPNVTASVRARRRGEENHGTDRDLWIGVSAERNALMQFSADFRFSVTWRIISVSTKDASPL